MTVRSPGFLFNEEVTMEFLFATLCGVAPAVFVDDGLIFCVAENCCAVFSGVSLCASHTGLLLIVVPAYISK